jgi:hypothetical protein
MVFFDDLVLISFIYPELKANAKKAKGDHQNELSTIQKKFDELEKSEKTKADENKKLAKENDELRKKLAAVEAKKDSEISDLKSTLDLVLRLSGLQIKDTKDTVYVNEDEVEERVKCFSLRQTGQKGSLDYDMMIPKEPTGMYTYVPRSSEDEMERLGLADFLFDDIEFEEKMASLFYWRVTDYLQRD